MPPNAGGVGGASAAAKARRARRALRNGFLRSRVLLERKTPEVYRRAAPRPLTGVVVADALLTGDALLIGGAAISLVTGNPAGAQVAQNDDSQMARVVPRAGAPESFADLTEQLLLVS